MKRIKLGQLGIGHNHAEGHMEAFRRHPELYEIIGYAETDASWIRRRGSLPCYAGVPRLSVEELLEKSDAILVETEVETILPAAKLCIDAGKPIHLDKPAGEDLALYAKLLAEAKAKGLPVHLGYLYRTAPAVKKVFSLAESGALGEILYVETAFSAARSKDYLSYLEHFKGGTMYIFGAHLIDMALRLMGEPQRVESLLYRTGADGCSGVDNATAFLHYKKGVSVIRTSAVEAGGWFRRELTVVGTQGTVTVMPFEKPTVRWMARKNGREDDYDKLADREELILPTEFDRYAAFPQEFYNCLMGQANPPYDYDYELTLQRILLKACQAL